MRTRVSIAAFFAAAVSAVSLSAFSVFGAPEQVQVDTIVLETEEASSEEVPADLGWKTEQDKGQWIEDMGIAGDAKSLVLILNNVDNGNAPKLPAAEEVLQKKMKQKEPLAGNSRLIYLSKSEDGSWQENFSANCFISGGQTQSPEEIYGVYRLESAFGSRPDPGSLVSYHVLTDRDYWITDVDDENYGAIFRAGKNAPEADCFVNLIERKAFSNYGMV